MEYFYRADETLKEALHKKDPYEATHALYQLISFIGIMAKENVPGRHEAICYEMDSKKANWTDMERINRELLNYDTALAFADGHMFFNHHDITKQAEDMGEQYIHNNWHGLGYLLGITLEENSGHEENLFLF